MWKDLYSIFNYIKLMINMEEIQEINKRFADGRIVNNSIYYALDQKSVRGKVGHILRSLIIDHTFSDGNKRTAFLATLLLFERANISIYKDTLTKIIIKIARENITDINAIGRMVERCIKR